MELSSDDEAPPPKKARVSTLTAWEDELLNRDGVCLNYAMQNARSARVARPTNAARRQVRRERAEPTATKIDLVSDDEEPKATKDLKEA